MECPCLSLAPITCATLQTICNKGSPAPTNPEGTNHTRPSKAEATLLFPASYTRDIRHVPLSEALLRNDEDLGKGLALVLHQLLDPTPSQPRAQLSRRKPLKASPNSAPFAASGKVLRKILWLRGEKPLGSLGQFLGRLLQAGLPVRQDAHAHATLIRNPDSQPGKLQCKMEFRNYEVRNLCYGRDCLVNHGQFQVAYGCDPKMQR